MQTLLLYFCGHGLQEQACKHPVAVGVDSSVVDLFSSFVRHVDAIDSDARNSIILFMDACLHHVGCADPGTGNTGPIVRPPLRMQTSLDSKDEEKTTTNLQVRGCPTIMCARYARNLPTFSFLSSALESVCTWQWHAHRLGLAADTD